LYTNKPETVMTARNATSMRKARIRNAKRRVESGGAFKRISSETTAKPKTGNERLPVETINLYKLTAPDATASGYATGLES